jgi:hypothetical protein
MDLPPESVVSSQIIEAPPLRLYQRNDLRQHSPPTSRADRHHREILWRSRGLRNSGYRCKPSKRLVFTWKRIQSPLMRVGAAPGLCHSSQLRQITVRSLASIGCVHLDLGSLQRQDGRTCRRRKYERARVR